MVMPAKKHQDHLPVIKDNIENTATQFKENIINWHKSKKFLYVSTIDNGARAVLEELGKPPLEFNILEAYVSRQKGEFAKQEPSIVVSNKTGSRADDELLDFLSSHIRDYERQSMKNGVASDIHDDMMSGGFSVAKVYHDYSHEMSFEQDIFFNRVYDPTLCGFDPLARGKHKGDGKFCFEIWPFRIEDFKEKFPNVDVRDLKYFKADPKKLNWTYKDNFGQEYLMMVEYYEKVNKRVKIVQLTDDQIMTEEDYGKFELDWDQSGQIGQAPQIVKSRTTTRTSILRYRIIQDQVLEVKTLSTSYLPLIFFDNNSVFVRKNEDGAISSDMGANDCQYIGNMEQITRTYFHQALGVQRLKDLAGQTIANDFENMVQHKFKLPIEGIPADYKDAYTNTQVPNTLMYHQFLDNDPAKRLDPPQEVPRVPLPPEVISTFNGTDSTTQAILGTYDAALGINNNQLSGVAIETGATQNNATAMPTIINYMVSYAQVARIILDLLPRIKKTPTTLPIINSDGQREFVEINQSGHPQLRYDPSMLNVEVTPGINFSLQKSKVVNQVTGLMQASTLFSAFINTKPGLKFLLKNIDIPEIDTLIKGVDQFVDENEKKQQQSQQENPMMMKMQLDAKDKEQKNTIAAAKVQIEAQDSQTNRMKTVGELTNANREIAMKEKNADAENTRSAVMAAKDITDMSHRHVKDTIEIISKNRRKDGGQENNRED